MIELKFKPVDMLAQTIRQDNGCYIRLYENRIEFKINLDTETLKDPEDKTLGSEEVYLNYHGTFKKEVVMGVELSLTREDQWCLAIPLAGVIEELKVYFDIGDHKKATKMRDEISAWLFGAENNFDQEKLA